MGRKLQGATAGVPTDGSLQRTGSSGRRLQQEAYPGVGAVARTVCASVLHSPESALPMCWPLSYALNGELGVLV